MHSKREEKSKLVLCTLLPFFFSFIFFFQLPVGHFLLSVYYNVCVMFSVEISQLLFLPCISSIGLVLFLFGFKSFVWLVGWLFSINQ